MPKVLNKSKDDCSNAVYIGRPSIYGNPFIIGKHGTRSEVVAKHKEWLPTQLELIQKIKSELVGRDLACWCAPKTCHGNIILEIANEPEWLKNIR